MIARWERDDQQMPFLPGVTVEIPVPLVPGHKGKFPWAKRQMVVLDLKVKGSFNDQKGFVVGMSVKWDALLWRDTRIEEGKGAVRVGSDGQQCDDSAGKVEGLPLPGCVSLHLLLPFLENACSSDHSNHPRATCPQISQKESREATLVEKRRHQ